MAETMTKERVAIVHRELHSKDLKLNLLNKLIDPDLYFTVLKQSRLEGRINVNAFIIGSSHVIIFNSGNQYLTEIFACQNIPKQKEFLKFTPFTGKKNFVIKEKVDSFSYSCAIDKYKWDEDIIRDMLALADNSLQHGNIGLKASFPSKEKSMVPHTVISIPQMSNEECNVKTLHSYPNENAIIITETSVKNKSIKGYAL